MQLLVVAQTSAAVSRTSSRLAKVGLLATTLKQAASDPADLLVVASWLSGELRQRRTGLGWAAVRGAPPPTTEPTLTVAEVDAMLAAAAATTGPGSATARRVALHDLLGRATAVERDLLTALISGELRQGSARGVMLEAVAAAAGLPGSAVRRAMTVRGDVAEVARAALAGELGTHGASGGGLLGRPVGPMLASSAPDVATALARSGPAVVDAKLDGVRLQVHVPVTGTPRLFTRSLDEITGRFPALEDALGALAPQHLPVVLDGEVLAVDEHGRPRPFQHTASLVATRAGSGAAGIQLHVFDLLHAGGRDLLDVPLDRRREAAAELLAGVPEAGPVRLVRSLAATPADGPAVEAFLAQVLEAGHEGVVVKAASSTYAAGRRGASWIKVKPRLTLDLVVLAAEWGHGRRQGWLSNLHLGARDPHGRYGPAGGFVMLGKTFKGLTDAMLAWQTERLTALSTGGSEWRVDVRPELVVEVALDGVQTSPRYPAAVALRFARVVAHRVDKRADEADTVDTVRALLPG